MGDDSKIEWTDATWNPVTGCTKVSPGCDHCYIERTPPFRMAGRRFDLPTIGGTTGVMLHHNRLDQPLRWKRPRLIFVNSLADLFHESVPDDYIAKVYAAMMASPQHTFQVLTKRHARMRSLLTGARVNGFMDEVVRSAMVDHGVRGGVEWPLRNVWQGVTVENQQWADIRVPALADTPAAVRFLSCEPLLGPVLVPISSQIDWVICGGESGPGSRPMDAEWARSLRDQCTAAGVSFHFKQWGEWYDGERLGKREAGRILDGRTWDEYPYGIG